MPRPKVGILFGGRSEEHDVSVRSAQEVVRHLDVDSFDPVWVGITREGEWRACDGPAPGWESRGCPALLAPDSEVHGLLVRDSSSPGRYELVHLDIVLPVLHGRFGEDGSIQGLLEVAGIPYVGCDVQSSTLCMDKSLTYLVARGAGVPTPAMRTVAPDDPIDRLAQELDLPVFVKPARSGSSFGVSKVDDPSALPDAVAFARRFDSKVLVEAAVGGVEVGCAVLGHGDELATGEPDQISLSHGFFRIHQEDRPEHGSENASIVVPAPIEPHERELVVETAKVVYRALGCRGLARVDMFLTPEGAVVLNEVNTLPGLTSYSRFPRMMAAAGVPFGELLDRLLSAALQGGSRAR